MRPRLVTGAFVALLLGAMASLAQPVPTVRVVRTFLVDNGDGDGWADSNETVGMRLHVRNAASVKLTGITAQLTSDDSRIECITSPRLFIGDLPAGETRTTTEAFVFKVANVDRLTVDQVFTAGLRITFSYDQLGALGTPPPQTVTLELDLDVGGGAGATTYFEGFENGFGTFSPMQIDEHLNPPDDDLSNREAGLINADGFRCQYSDPDWEESWTFGKETCFPNPSGAADAFHFDVTTDRAFGGAASMYYGVYLDEMLGFTTPLGQLEAVVTTDPVNLAWRGTCSTDGGTCDSDGDCPAGDYCAPPVQTLSFKQQVSLVDHRTLSFNREVSVDRAVVQVQGADADGQPVGHWIKIPPYRNAYDTAAVIAYANCYFDPTDDGNTEEDFFDPADPFRYLGPSSTCSPELNFVDQGSTSGAFDPGNLGDASDGPGLQGASGEGTWVEPRFDLSRFRGQRVRLRFLTAGIKVGGFMTWQELFGSGSLDDGWFIDDVTLTGALAQPAEVVVDDKDNGGLPALEDEDGDGVLCDNCPDVVNPDQLDSDGDDAGDACDPCPLEVWDDRDGDGWCCPEDNCCMTTNPFQEDSDGDDVGNACDNCQSTPNPEQADDVHPGGPGDACEDPDGDSVFDDLDNCPDLANVDQVDSDGDGRGDACDNCPLLDTSRVVDLDGDGVGDACDSCVIDPNVGDDDGDGIDDVCDNCPGVANEFQLLDTDVDGHGDACDNCPFDGNGSQSDRDGDGSGDTCDRCPDGPAVDADNDSIDCADDNCPTDWNLGQEDADGDGIGDLCDDCPADAANDVDGDGHCGDRDNCPTQPNQDQWNSIRLSGDHPGLEAVWRVSFDGTRVIYRAEKHVSPVEQLYSVSTTGGPPSIINPPLPDGKWVTGFSMPRDGTTLAYRTDNRYSYAVRLYSVPIEGGTVVPLIPDWSADVDVTSYYSVSWDGAYVVFLADRDEPGVLAFYSVPTDGSQPAVQISGQLVSGGEFHRWRVTPSGQLVFIADAEEEGRLELYSVPVAGGERIRLSGEVVPGGDVLEFLHSDDGAWVAYRADQHVEGSVDLYLVPAKGGASRRLTSNGLGGGYRFGPLSKRLFFTMHAGPVRLYQVDVRGGSPVFLLEEPGSYTVTPDGREVLYLSDPDGDGGFTVHAIPVEGGESREVTPLDAQQSVRQYTISPDLTTIVFTADLNVADQFELFAMPVGGGTLRGLSGPMVAGGDVGSFSISSDSEWVVYRADQRDDGEAELFRARLDGSLSAPLAPEPPNYDVGYSTITSDGSTLVYVAEQRFDFVDEIFAIGLEPDVDEDGILTFCDVCPEVADPDQQDGDGDGAGAVCDCDDADPATFPGAGEVNDGADNQCPGEPGYGLVDELDGEVRFADPQRLIWTAQPRATSYEVARFTTVDFTDDCVRFVTEEPFLDDVTLPAVGVVFHYLVRAWTPYPGSWGATSAGAERHIECPQDLRRVR